MKRKTDQEVERRNAQADHAWKEYMETGQYVSHENMVAYLDIWGTAINISPPIQEKMRKL